MEFVNVVKPGLLTTVQDLGRHSYRTFGVSSCGAMDPLSLRLANILVGNNEGEAALEVTLFGLELRFNAEGVIAITGGNLSPNINGKPVSMWKALRVRKDDYLRFGSCIDGCRAYISFAGGIEVPKVMGSRSTFVRGNYGGNEGRALKAGDCLPIGSSPFYLDDLYGRRLRPDDIPDFKKQRLIRFILGPHDKAFTNESLETFMTTPYMVSNESDRMGYRLQGARLEHVAGADIISDFITVGTIQVPGSGQPIIHMADCGTSGGYTKIGVIASVDISYMAQRKPGDQTAFEAVEIKDAQAQLKKQEQFISKLHLSNAMIPRRKAVI
jgi:antagonist of KipI